MGATSSRELGIDLGAVDLVVPVGAPPSVASGLQRIGRAGHQVGAVSHGVVFPTFRGDLVPATQDVIRAGSLPEGESFWDIIVQPGRVWKEEGDGEWSRAYWT